MIDENGPIEPAPEVDFQDPKLPIKSDVSKSASQANATNALNLLKANVDNFTAIINKLPNLGVGGEEVESWGAAVQEAMRHTLSGGVFDDAIKDTGGQWTNRPTFDDKPLTTSRLKGGNKAGNLSGESGLMKVRARLGLGTIMTIPLFHTGGWVTLKAPSNGSILELQRRVSQEKISLGRLTNGMIFSSSSIYIQSYLINFVLGHIYETNLGTNDPNELKQIIKSTDIPSLVLGILCTMYPDGYTLREPCAADPGNCSHIEVSKINLSRIRVTDMSRLSDKQLKEMSKRNVARTEETLKAYSDEFSFKGDVITATHDNGSDINIHLTVPSILEYEESGFKWVDGIVSMVDRAFKVPLKGDERNAYIRDQGRLSNLRQYSHWISKVTIGDLNNDDVESLDVITDRDVIDDFMVDLSGIEHVRDAILNGVGAFISETTVSIVGYPNDKCPSCDMRLGDEKEGSGTDVVIVRSNDVVPYVPLDLTTTFFTLCSQRVQLAIQTSL